MKREFFFRSSRNTRRESFGGLAAMVVVLCAVVFAADYVTDGFFQSEVRRAGGAALSSAASVASAVEGSGFFTSRRALQAENEMLRRELTIAAERLASVQLLRNENEALRELANLAAEEAGVAARVISSYRATPYGTFMIGAGRRDGVVDGAIVLTEGGYVLGIVTGAGEYTATVKTVFAPGEDVDLVVRDIAFTAKGQGSGNARADVPREAQLFVGDVARAPAFGG
ncbi:MAG TPA: rod shape-determining protein MreC, partial [Candidatus Paceibacterota bacterium]|nr:rod shape-determining protein MreC [Candidatus Paceibacterota bacterium]